MQDEDFRELIDESIDTLPKEFLEKLENVSVTFSDWPTPFQLSKLRKRGQGGFLLGLYEGIPQTKRRNYGVGGTLPDKITIFKFPLLTISKDIESLKQNVKNTVIHEIAHHFGMNEEEIRKRGK
ncbi:MAG: metallopeptidase family protein [Candidatus Woesebacteria bacterium]|jgi:predicted Zn-dependent protease with MMP-like domain